MYVRAVFSAGYGLPHWIWAGVDSTRSVRSSSAKSTRASGVRHRSSTSRSVPRHVFVRQAAARSSSMTYVARDRAAGKNARTGPGARSRRRGSIASRRDLLDYIAVRTLDVRASRSSTTVILSDHRREPVLPTAPRRRGGAALERRRLKIGVLTEFVASNGRTKRLPHRTGVRSAADGSPRSDRHRQRRREKPHDLGLALGAYRFGWRAIPLGHGRTRPRASVEGPRDAVVRSEAAASEHPKGERGKSMVNTQPWPGLHHVRESPARKYSPERHRERIPRPRPEPNDRRCLVEWTEQFLGFSRGSPPHSSATSMSTRSPMTASQRHCSDLSVSQWTQRVLKEIRHRGSRGSRRSASIATAASTATTVSVTPSPSACIAALMATSSMNSTIEMCSRSVRPLRVGPERENVQRARAGSTSCVRGIARVSPQPDRALSMMSKDTTAVLSRFPSSCTRHRDVRCPHTQDRARAGHHRPSPRRRSPRRGTPVEHTNSPR